MFQRLLKEIIPDYSEIQKKHSHYKFNSTLLIALVWLFSCVYLINNFQIESNYGFDKVAAPLAVAFLVYTMIPLQLRKLFMFSLALGLEIYLIGFKVGIGVSLILLAFTGFTYIKHKKWRHTVVLLASVACVLIMSRIIIIPYVRTVLLFGALFLMLRYIYFLYELSHFAKPPVFIDRLTYLFLVPNACFPLFPVIDPKAYLSSFYENKSEVSLLSALNNITIGILHLLIYRLVYFYLTPSAYDVDGFWKWLQFVLSSYSLIFRLSGLFFLAIGFVELFGFKFQKVFDYVYFAQGFSDMWRRVNLPWRAFMMRLFYFPVSFRFKKFNQLWVIFICTNFMFFITWLLHSWQWYWIKGTYFFNPNDIVFWFNLGFLVSVNSVLTYNNFKNGNTVSSGNKSLFEASVNMLGLFLVMSLLWSLWTSTSLTEFVYLLTFALKGNAVNYLIVLTGIVVLVFMFSGIRYLHYRKNFFKSFFEPLNPQTGLFICLGLIGCTLVLDKTILKHELQSFKSMALNNRDKSIYERGYYDLILNNDEKAIELFNSRTNLTKWNVDNKAYKRTDNVLMKEFIPDFITTFKGDTLQTNSFGMRDKEYNLIKDNSVLRFAFIGGSYVMGSGVSNNENFSALLEEKINKQSLNRSEILNFGAGGYHLIQSVKVNESKVLPFKPDYLFYFIHSSDRTRCLEDFVNMVQKQVNLDYTELRAIVKKAKVDKKMCRLEIYNRLKPFINEVMIWGYKKIADESRINGTVPVLAYLPAQASLKQDEDKDFCLTLAKSNGFKIIDLSNVYDGYVANDIQLAPWDAHPNEKGHQIIADKLYTEMKLKGFIFKE